MSRLSPGTVIVGIFAVLFGLVGAYAVRKSLQKTPSAPATTQLTSVPMASIDLEPGRSVTLGDVSLQRMAAEQLREAKFPDGYMLNPQQIIGRTLRTPIKRGQTFMTDNFYPEGVGPTVSERLKPGLRAVTVPIANTAAVAGMASPGSFVDVLFRTTPNTAESLPQTTITLLESVEVLAYGQNMTPGARPPNAGLQTTTVTMAVSPEQAAALKVVENRGDLMLTLRGPSDLEFTHNVQPQTLESLLGLVQPGPALTTDIYRGGTKATTTFQKQLQPAQITRTPVRSNGTTPTSALVVPSESSEATKEDRGENNHSAAGQEVDTLKAKTGGSIEDHPAKDRKATAPASAAELRKSPGTNARLDNPASLDEALSPKMNQQPVLQPSPQFNRQSAVPEHRTQILEDVNQAN